MTNFDRITKSIDDLVEFIEEDMNVKFLCPPEPWPCQCDVNNTHCKTCKTCWRLWMEAEEE